jgi:hypothetical protein
MGFYKGAAMNDKVSVEYLEDIGTSDAKMVADAIDEGYFKTENSDAVLGIERIRPTSVRISFGTTDDPTTQVIGAKDCVELSEFFAQLAVGLKPR